jgi:hypothetical protein
MLGQASVVPDWPGARIPEFIRDLTSLAVGVISRDGILIDGNLGFFNLLPDSMTAADMLDVREVFVNPRFDQLTTRQPDRSGAPIYKGIINITSVAGAVSTLHGAIYALTDSVLLVAEHQVAGLELLRSKVLRLNDDLAEEQRKLAAALRESRRQEMRAEAALRELAQERRLLTEARRELNLKKSSDGRAQQ